MSTGWRQGLHRRGSIVLWCGELPPNAGKSLASTDAETLLESIHTDTVVTLEGWPSSEEHWPLLWRTQVPFPASTSQPFITPILGEPMTSSGLCQTLNTCHTVHGDTRRHTHKKFVNHVKLLSFTVTQLGQCLPSMQEA